MKFNKYEMNLPRGQAVVERAGDMHARGWKKEKGGGRFVGGKVEKSLGEKSRC